MSDLPSYNRIAPDVQLGVGVRLFGFVNLYGCAIGDETRIGTFVEVQKNAIIGARCKISSHTFICEGVTIEDEVFVGHGVMFLNDADPCAVTQGVPSTEADWTLLPTRVCRGASIGSGAVILGGVTIGDGALVGAGAVVTRDVLPGAVVVGNPARFLRMRRKDEAESLPMAHKQSETAGPLPGRPVRDETESFPAPSGKHETVAVPTTVPLIDVKRHLDDIDLQAQIRAAIQEVVDSGTYVLGPWVERFEREFAASIGVKHCVGVNSGTSALHLALICAGVGPGDQVITVPMTFVSTAWAISYVGAIPVFVDVDPVTCTMDVTQVEQKITPQTRAILPVHLYGQPADMAPLLAIGARHGIPVIEDAAQAAGSRYHNRSVGSFGLCGCFSYYPSKNLGAYGEAGAIVTDDEEVATRLRALRDHAQQRRHVHDEVGYNYRMDAFQGAVLSVKLPWLARWVADRRRLAARYLRALADLPLQLPTMTDECSHGWHLFVVRHPERDLLRASLEAHGVLTGLHYPVPVHLQPAYASLGYEVGSFPVAEQIARECLTLPLFPEMTLAEQDRVIEALTAILTVGGAYGIHA